ncbi:glycosyltransferase family 4 protein [Caloramator sp. ALD01]|uniref:glycosyltransferase family 4 protein n=1 Tax=Caloramator sp. ALD01 TaxID=1031288 RepID=UPI0004245699|nr:glycosyltransferase family 4 protein [Caloramator sp. ALD01]
MKILVVCQYYYPEPFRITDICESLLKVGHDVTVLTGLPNYPEGIILQEYRYGNRRKEILNGVKIIRCFEIGRGKSKIKLFLNYLSYVISATLKVLFMKEEFDVVFVNQLSPVMMAIPAIVYKMKHKKKILLYCLDLWPDSLSAGGVREDSIIYKIFYKISKWIYKSVDMILVTSSMFEDYFKNILQINNVNIKHLPQYAEDFFIQKCEEPFKEVVATTENKTYNFVFAGNIGYMQSVETIIKSANELKEIKNIYFHIVGDGSKLDECKKLTEGLKLQNIIFYGRKPVEEMPKFYNMADAMLITLKDNKALSYTLPGKVQSYMAAGKPIIGAINGETRRVISEANCGLTCKAEDYKALANLIKKFCDSNEKNEMGKNARKFYLENYSKDNFMTVLEWSLKKLEV